MSHIIDCPFYGNGFGTQAMREVFSPQRRFQRWLDVEAALALVQAELGVIPAAAAREIAARASIQNVDLERVRLGIEETDHSLVPLLRELQRACSDGAGEFVHYGATTQDIQDTASMLEMRDALDLVVADLRSVARLLGDLSERHLDSVMPGRTHGQHGLVTTYGYRLSVGLSELMRHLDRARELRGRCFVVSLFGGVGTMSSIPRGIETARALAERLGLGMPEVSWHTSRDRIAEFACLLAQVAASVGRACNDVFVLARSECGEVREGHVAGRLGSSTMPHKRNPEVSQQVVLLARLAKYQAAVALESMIAEDDRDARSLRSDWVSLQEVSCYAAAAVQMTRELLEHIDVRPERMAANVALQKDFMYSEALMFELGHVLGKQTAHQVVYDAAMTAHERDTSILDQLMLDDRVAGRWSRDALAALLTPESQLGAARELARAAIESSRTRLEEL